MKTAWAFIILGGLVVVAGAIWFPSDRFVIALILGAALIVTGGAGLYEKWQRRPGK